MRGLLGEGDDDKLGRSRGCPSLSVRQASTPPLLTPGLFGSLQTGSIRGEQDGGCQEGFPMPVVLLGSVVPWFAGCSPDWSRGACTALPGERDRALPARVAAAVCGSWGRGHSRDPPATHLSHPGKQG